MQRLSSHCAGKHVVPWLLQCWDFRAGSLESEVREAKQLGSLSREGGIEKAIGNGAQALSLCRRLLSGVKEGDPFKEDVGVFPMCGGTPLRVGLLRLEEQQMLTAITMLHQRQYHTN